MNSHGDNKNKQGAHEHGPFKHILHMVLCCGLPMLLVGFLPVIAKYSPGTGNIIGRIVPFLCPIMMIGMFFMMMGGKRKGSCCDDVKENPQNKQLELNKPIE